MEPTPRKSPRLATGEASALPGGQGAGVAEQLPLAFVDQPILVPIDRLLPSRKEPQAVRESKKFKQLKASIEAVGLIELRIPPHRGRRSAVMADSIPR